MKVKICGITNQKDALSAAKCGADAVGVVNIKESPRYVSLKDAEDIFSILPVFVSRVVVATPKTMDEVRKIEETGADYIQLHGNESLEQVKEIAENSRLRIIKAIAAQDGCETEARIFSRVADAILLDTKMEGALGGTGMVHDWDISRRVVEVVDKPVILAGGLTAENVARAAAAVNPYAVDVSNGVEASPGKKDEKKIAEFITRAKK
jgi:phosphoribosylanthranilate isomerase